VSAAEAPILELSDVHTYYGSIQALKGISLDVREGEIVTLLGANGAGKTSVIRAVAGLVPVAGEHILYDGQWLDHSRPGRRVGLGIATVPEGRDLFHSLTVAENLRMGAYLRRDRTAIKRDLDWIYDLFPPLAAKKNANAATLSGGQGQMLAIGRGLMADPRLLLLDEPSHGLAPNLVDEVFDLIPRLRRERNLSILLVEQAANRALAVADYGYVLETGTLALQGPTVELKHDPRVRALYLGG
jgi:branched-chain amino acid transport system ATP-binding protein